MIKISFATPPETTAVITNPERGFYSIYVYEAGEEAVSSVEMPYSAPQDVLLLAEINLCKYSKTDIPPEALDNMRLVFSQLRTTGMQLIVRFVYDTEGKNLANEPRSIDIILNHMKQVADIVKENADIIYVLQGLFIGDWGEMHGTRYSGGNHLKQLYTTLSDAVADTVPVAVRTPAQWRSMLGFLGNTESISSVQGRTALPGLFNDGMMGSVSDLGTYGESEGEREAEIRFQERLCRYTQNGGEAVGRDKYSEPAQAINTLARMHVSYLGRYHDKVTLEAWQKHVMRTSDVWNGKSFFEYTEAHLGYRYLICDVKIKKVPFGKEIAFSFCIKNIGFAPIYHDADIYIDIVSGDNCVSHHTDGNVRGLYGCSDNVKLACSLRLPVADVPDKCDVYVRLHSRKYDCTILTANEGSTEKGLCIGGIVK